MTDVRRILSENRRVVWALAAALVINATLYALVVYPLSQRVTSGQQQSGDATREMLTARRAFDAARGTITGKKEADAELQKFYREVLPSDFSAARRTLYPHLDQLARTANLKTVNYAWAPDQGKTGSLRKITMTLTLEGEYSDVRRFIHELETAPEFLVLESVGVTTAAEGDRQLKVLALVATYYRTADDGN